MPASGELRQAVGVPNLPLPAGGGIPRDAAAGVIPDRGLDVAVLQLAAAVAALAVRGWASRALAALLALVSFAVGYLGLSLWAVPAIPLPPLIDKRVHLVFSPHATRPGTALAVPCEW